MCAPISGSRMAYIAAEIARSRRVAQGAPPVAAPSRHVSPTTARMVEINTPIGVLTFYQRQRSPAQRLRGVIVDLAAQRRQTVPQMLESLAA